MDRMFDTSSKKYLQKGRYLNPGISEMKYIGKEEYNEENKEKESLTIIYIPDKYCLEAESLKNYLLELSKGDRVQQEKAKLITETLLYSIAPKYIKVNIAVIGEKYNSTISYEGYSNEE